MKKILATSYLLLIFVLASSVHFSFVCNTSTICTVTIIYTVIFFHKFSDILSFINFLLTVLPYSRWLFGGFIHSSSKVVNSSNYSSCIYLVCTYIFTPFIFILTVHGFKLLFISSNPGSLYFLCPPSYYFYLNY